MTWGKVRDYIHQKSQLGFLSLSLVGLANKMCGFRLSFSVVVFNVKLVFSDFPEWLLFSLPYHPHHDPSVHPQCRLQFAQQVSAHHHDVQQRE